MCTICSRTTHGWRVNQWICAGLIAALVTMMARCSLAEEPEPQEPVTLTTVAIVVTVVGIGVGLYQIFGGEEPTAYAYGYAKAGGTWNPWCGSRKGEDEKEAFHPSIRATADSGSQSICGASARAKMDAKWTLSNDEKTLTFTADHGGTFARPGPSYAYAQYIANGKGVTKVKSSVGGAARGESGEEMYEVSVDVVLNDFSLGAKNVGSLVESASQFVNYHNEYTGMTYNFDAVNNGDEFMIEGADEADFSFDPDTGLLTAPSSYVLFHESFMISEETDIPLLADYGGDLEGLEMSSVPPNGDFNFDGHLDCADVDQLVFAIVNQVPDPLFDITFDGMINQQDLEAWLSQAGAINLGSFDAYLPGDANLDGLVDGADFLIWNANKFSQTPAWCAADFNADGNVDGNDFVIWNQHKFQQSGQNFSVPEPASAVLLGGLLLVGLTGVRRRFSG